MMEKLKLPPGLERQNTAYDSVDRWWDMNLIRWRSGKMEPVGGWTRATSTALGAAVRKMHTWRDNAGDTRMQLVGADDKIYSVIDGSYTDVTPASFIPLTELGAGGGYGTFDYGEEDYGDARASVSPIYATYSYYTFGQWGEDIIWTANSDGRLFYYDTSSPSTACTVVSGAPTDCHATIVTEERHVMVFGGTDSGTHYPHRVFWSTRENNTDWNYASTTNSAGYQDLNTQDPLRRGVLVREGVLIFSDSAVFLAEYVGQPFIYKFTRISDTALMNPDSVATFNGKAVWLSRSGWQVYSGGSVEPIECPILAQIQEEMDDLYGPFRLHASHNGIFPEVWTFYPSTDETECDRYVIWNYAEGWWAWGSLSRTAMTEASSYRRPFMGGSDGHVYEHETGWTDAGASRVGDVWIESGALGLGDSSRAIEINQAMIANGVGADSLTFTLYGKFTPEGDEVTYGPYTPRSDGYIDTRGNGRHTRLRIEAAEDVDWGVGTIYMDVTQGAAR